jgi:DNA-binding transcriptional LysR family regulator
MVRDFNVDQIKKLWILDLIIQTGSLKKAALHAKVSPSAISQSLSSLEQTIGKPLLVRARGSVTPTPEAVVILQTIRPAFDVFDRLKDLNHAPVPELAWLNFGTYESIAINILPGLIRRLREKMPKMRLGLRISRTNQLLTMVRKGELCSALITEVDDLNRFYIKEVGSDRLGFFVSRHHPISKMGWDAAKTYGIGSLAPGNTGLPRYFTKFLRQIKSERPTLLSDSFETLRCAAASGVLVSVLPHRVAQRNSDLLEIYPGDKKSSESLGVHKLLIVSPTNCDPSEADFLSHEIRLLLDR